MSEDPYAKLKPAPPTPQEEMCSCTAPPALSVYRTFGENPLHCLACNGSVAPERVGLAADVAEELAEWRDFYAAFDNLWLDSGEFEDWAREQLEDPASPVNARGLMVVERLSSHVPAYLGWFQEPGAESFVPRGSCPRCDEMLSARCEELVCESCRIVVFN